MNFKLLVCSIFLELVMEEMVRRMPWARGEVKSRVQSWVIPAFKGQGTQRRPRQPEKQERNRASLLYGRQGEMCLKKEGMVKIFSWKQSKIKTEKRPLTWATILALGDSSFHRKGGQKPDYNVQRQWAVKRASVGNSFKKLAWEEGTVGSRLGKALGTGRHLFLVLEWKDITKLKWKR